MKRIRTATFRGKRYAVQIVPPSRAPKGEWAGAVGLCDPPQTPGKVLLLVNDRGAPLDTLETAVHEAMHACVFDLSEEAVTAAAEDVARFLWRLGYRLENR